MIKYNIKGSSYWVGCHKSLGYVIFDPTIYQSIEDRVQLWLVSKNKFSEFKKDVVKDYLVSNEMLKPDCCLNMLNDYLSHKVKEMDETGVQYIATSETEDMVFHKTTCDWMRNVPDKSIVNFDDRSHAIRIGYRSCKACHS